MPDVALMPRLARGTAKAAAVSLLVMAPMGGQAASFTVNGFTELFAPATWDYTTVGGGGDTGSGTLSSTTMSLTSGTTPAEGNSYAQYEFDTSNLMAGFQSGTVTFNWTWTTASLFNTPPYDPLYYYVGSASPVQLPVYDGSGEAGDPANWIQSGSSVTFNVTAGQVFGFRITNDGAGDPVTATGTISGFSFTGSFIPQPVEVPGPLPVMAALAGLAWSRKLRSRIALSRASASKS